jgi:oligopeptide transport system permease protein
MTEATRQGGADAQGVPADLSVPPADAPAGAEMAAARTASLWSDAWYDLRRNPLFVMSGLLIAVLVLMAAWPSLFSSIDATDARNCDLGQARGQLGGPHWFGQDNQGCDVYARTIYGARNSIVIGMMTTMGTALFGGFFGLISGYFGGWFDGLLSRITDVFFAIPLILGGLLILSTFRTGNIWTVTFALGVISWPMVFRVMRGAVLTTKSLDYVVAARALGAGPPRIMLRHILPNAVAPVIVVATVNLGVFIAAEAALSYLGIGIQSPAISWGLMIADAQPRFLEAWWPLVFPAGFLALTVLSFIMLGDAVRDALDPKLR